MSSNYISIKGLDKVELLKRLWSQQIPGFLFALCGLPKPEFMMEQAKNAVQKHIDYFCGCAIKTDLSRDEIDPYLYDRDAGQGTFAQIVENMRNENDD